MIRIEEDNKNPMAEKAKKATKKIVKRILTLKVVLVIAIVIAIITILSAITWFFFKDSGVWGKEEKGRPNIYTDNVKMDPKEGIVIDKEAIIKQALLDLGLSEDEINNMSEQDKIAKLKLSEKLNKTINSFDDCTAAEILWCLSDEYSKYINKPEQLEKLLMAELVTQYPYIDGLDESKTNGVIKFYRYANTGEVDFKSTYENAGKTEEEQQEQEEKQEENSTEQEIDASKIFYIGDSWMNGLKGKYGTNKDYFCCKDGAFPKNFLPGNSAYKLDIAGSMKSDASAIVLMLGLNGTTSEIENMKKVIDLITEKYPDKQLYVLKLFHVGKKYSSGTVTASGMNLQIDQYNAEISSYCNSKENVMFVDTTTGLLDGEGYLSSKYAGYGNYHLNSDGYQIWYYNIEQALKAGGGARTNISDQEYYRIKYIDSEKFDEMYAEYESSGNRDVFKYFTLDEEGNAKIATWTKVTGVFTTQNGQRSIGEIQSLYDSRYQQTSSGGAAFTEYTASITSINYKTMSEKYTMPFEYLWALLVEGEDYDFVERVANLTYNTEFNIGIYDSINTSTDVQKNYYTKVLNRKRYHTGLENKATVTSRQETVPCVDISTITTETDMVTYDIAYANTWIVEVWTKYIASNFNGETNKDVTIMEGQKNNLSEAELKEKLDKFEENEDKDELINAEEGEEILINTPNVKETETTEITETNDMTTNEQTSVNNSYERSTSDVREKVDIDPTTGDNFVKALRESENAFRLLTNHGTMVWLCEILEENEDTTDMVDLTKALIQKALHPDEDIDFDFSIFSPENFNNVDGGIYGNTVEEKVWFSLRAAGFSEEAVAGAMGSIFAESGFDSTAVNPTSGASGICQWLGGRKTGLINYAKSKGTTWEDIDAQVEFLIGELSGSGPAASYTTRRTSGSIKGQKSTFKNWEQAKTVRDAAWHYMTFFESPGSTADFETKRYPKAQEYYNMFKGKTMTNGGDASNLLQAADNVARYVEARNYEYLGTGSVNYTFPIANVPSRRTLSCSSYVQECLLQAGYSQCSGGEKLWARVDPQLSLKDFNRLGIKVQMITDMTQLKPGDILQYRNGFHVVIVYSINGDGSITTKGVPEVLNAYHGFQGKKLTQDLLRQKRCYALRIIE